MTDIIRTEKPIKIIEKQGINVYLVQNDKFKTNSISIFFHDNLTKDHAALNALLPMVLRRGTKNLPTLEAISKHLEDLFGASFDCGISKKGERHISFYYIEVVNDAYTLGDNNVISQAFNFISDILFNPIVENGEFSNSYVEQEKDNLKRLIASRVNDKRQYATSRCYEEMCINERYGIYEYGNIEDVESISSKNLYNHYKTMLETMPIDIFVVGDVDTATITRVFHEYFDFLYGIRKNIINPKTELVSKSEIEPRIVFEKMDVNQGKLCLGLRTNTFSSDEDYYALAMCNGILGGGVHSKLFQNVREKASLAYYAYSRIERFKGLMLIGSGIEVDNYEKALDIIRNQIEEIKAGNISSFEFDSTVKSIETTLKSMTDSHVEMADFLLSQSICGNDFGVDDFIKKIRGVTKEEVIKVANKIKLDTIYFLTNK